MRDERALLANAYDAYNARDLDGLRSALHPDAEWPDSLENGVVVGREAVVAYFARLFETLQVDARPIAVIDEPPARIRVDIQYAVRDKQGNLWSDTRATLIYDFEDQLIRRMTVVEGL